MEESERSDVNNPFKSVVNSHYLKQLFFETTGADKAKVMYTLKDEDWEGYPSLYRLYMETGDVTEYLFADTYLDNWSHWEKLCRCTWFKEHITRWRKELSLKKTAEVLQYIEAEAKDPSSKNRFQAAKIVLDMSKTGDNSKRGRPSAEEIQGALKEDMEEEKRLQDDYNRLTTSE